MGKYKCKDCVYEFVLGEPSQEEMEKKPDAEVECPKCGSKNTKLVGKVTA